MKLRFLIFESRSPEWVSEGRDAYVKKISGFVPFEIKSLRSPLSERDQAIVKRRREAEILLKNLDERDYVVLFDEAGKLARDSETFARGVATAVESGKARVVFVIGGPYGFDESVRARAQSRWSLSPLTMNHWIAQLTALEQIYRGLTIIKGIPYHNR